VGKGFAGESEKKLGEAACVCVVMIQFLLLETRLLGCANAYRIISQLATSRSKRSSIHCNRVGAPEL
jgi:hypothetical protein